MFDPKRTGLPIRPIAGKPADVRATEAKPTESRTPIARPGFVPSAVASSVRTTSPASGLSSLFNLPKRDGNLREFTFTSADFERVRKLIYEHAGISLSAAKQDMVYSRLARRLRATGKENFGDYLAMLERGDKTEWELFVNSLTTNLTSFFREPHHFPILAEHLKEACRAQCHSDLVLCFIYGRGAVFDCHDRGGNIQWLYVAGLYHCDRSRYECVGSSR